MRITSSGQIIPSFDPLDVRRLTAEEIAWSLEGVIRWGGHSKPRYSTAQHSVAIARYIIARGGALVFAWAGLHHDDSDALLPDVPTLIKRQPDWASFRALEKRVLGALVEQHAPQALPWVLHTKPYDWAALGTEFDRGFPKTAAMLRYRDWHEEKWPDFGHRIPERFYAYQPGDWLTMHRWFQSKNLAPLPAPETIQRLI